MARTFVFSDNLAARAELIHDDVAGEWRAYCAGCSPAYDRYDSGPDLLRDTHERFSLEDAEQVAAIHVDQCRRCADPDCRTQGRHDAGHRCRKD
jgi:hypothetical protein